MAKKITYMNRDRVIEEFKKYTADYNPSDVKVKLKIEHTYRVAGLCDDIARSLGLDEKNQDFAWLSGMLHDIGRFEQLRRFNTFRDKDSINHAQLSADLLFGQERLITRFVEEDEFDLDMLDKVIRYHNAFRLPAKQDERELMFCNILRDADKIDILKVNYDTPRTEIYNLPEEAFTESFITDEVFNDIMASGNVNREHSKTGVDFVLGHIAFIYGLVFPRSLQLVKEQGYIWKLLDFKSNNPDTVKKLGIIKAKIEQDLNRGEA